MKFFLYSAFVMGLAAFLGGCTSEQPTAPTTQTSIGTKGNLKTVASTATINAGTVQQTIRGFGGANIVDWTGDMTSAQRTQAFSTSSGIGLSVLRVRVSPDNTQWSDNVATMNAAKSSGAMVIATCWSPPASMKTNNSTIGGDLSTGSYSAYASFLSSFCSTVGGVSAISPDNEPNITVSYESMNMSATEIGNFIASYGGNCGAPIMAPEPYNMSQSFINSYLSNSTAKSKTSYVCGHIYGVTPSTYNPGKEVWMTEHYTDTNDGNGWPGALGVATDIHNCMNAGYTMYVWWYIVRSYGLINSSGITKRGYVMAHYARYVRPGYSKISCTANPTSGVYVTAYKSGSQIVVVAINNNTSTTYQAFSYSGVTISGFDRYQTTSSSNLAHDSFSASAGSFGINLQASSMTTLVSH